MLSSFGRSAPAFLLAASLLGAPGDARAQEPEPAPTGEAPVETLESRYFDSNGVRLLDHLGIDRPHVIGYSRGGRIAHHLRAGHPGRLRSVVLGGYGEGSDEEDALGPAARSDLADAMERGDYRPLVRAVVPELAAEEVDAWDRRLREMNDGRALSAAFRPDPLAD